MVKADRLSSIARGTALFIGIFALLNVIAALRHSTFDGNEWWVDLRVLPTTVSRTTIAALATLLATWAIRPRMSTARTALTISFLVLAIAVVLYNAMTFYRLKGNGVIVTPVPAPFSILVAFVLAIILWRAAKRPSKLSFNWAAVSFIACAFAFPLAQTVAYGLTDYRRPAAPSSSWARACMPMASLQMPWKTVSSPPLSFTNKASRRA